MHIFLYLIISMLYRLGLWLGLGKLRYHTGGSGGLPSVLGLGKLGYHSGGLPPGLGLGKLGCHTGGPGACPLVEVTG